jgi:hypothetical protein
LDIEKEPATLKTHLAVVLSSEVWETHENTDRFKMVSSSENLDGQLHVCWTRTIRGDAVRNQDTQVPPYDELALVTIRGKLFCVKKHTLKYTPWVNHPIIVCLNGILQKYRTFNGNGLKSLGLVLAWKYLF